MPLVPDSPRPDPYDDLPYTEHAYAESHPDRLAVVARLAKWPPPEVTTARVLELGCGRGGNLLPMAAALPEARLVGVDRSPRQVEHARTVAAAAGLSNVVFDTARFEEPRPQGPPDGTFDYVIAHGVCSWVAPSARRALLRAIADALAPGGLAYMSFNALPGWYDRMAARDWLRTMGNARDLGNSLEWLREQVSPELADYRRRLDAVARRLAETDAAYATHEYLAAEHHPQLVSATLAEAAASGLSYLGDAIFSETALELLPDAVRARARTLDVASTQQLVDFVRNTAFRRAIFVRADEARARGWMWPHDANIGALDSLRVASRLRPHGSPAPNAFAERFDGADVSVHVEDPAARAALRELARVAPRSIPFPELGKLAGAGPARQELFDLWLATGAVDLHTYEPPLADGSNAMPIGCPVARYHAIHGGPITNRWHQEVRLDPPLRDLLALLDGTRGKVDLERGAHGTLHVRAGLAALAAAALLVG
jgi:SAM-dependent methyltransferase